MGWEQETQERRIAFSDFQVNDELMALGRPEAIFMHCLPALRGEEVTDEVIDPSARWSSTRPRIGCTRRRRCC